MEKNVGKLDQQVRYVLAALLIILGLITGAWWLYIIAVISAATAAMSFCGLYKVFGINTAK